MITLISGFFISFAIALAIIKIAGKHRRMLDSDFSGTQKFHSKAVPRFGGIAIVAAFAGTSLITFYRASEIGSWLGLLLLAGIAAFIGGTTEDYTKNVKPKYRLLMTMLSAAIGYYVLSAAIHRFDWYMFDQLLVYPALSFIITIIAVAGIANAVNIIDGFNGLAGVVTMFMFLSLGYVAWQVGDTFIMTASLAMIGAIAGFLLWNYPYGLIFLGDGGAYFIGFMLAELVILLVARNHAVSAWYAMLLMIYPIFETIFSIYRKKIVRGVSPGIPDGVHLHMLVFKRLVRWTVGTRDARELTKRNSVTSLYLCFLSLLAVIPATLFWTNKWILASFCLLFVVSYIWLYLKIIRFKAPRWIVLRKDD